jgi:hypothetical protein
MREEEQELRRLELVRVRDRDAKEAERQNTVASKIKTFGMHSEIRHSK